MIEYVNEIGVELVDALASDDKVAMSAWVSFDKDREDQLNDRIGISKLIEFLYRNDHMSPFEHGQFQFKVDIPLFVVRELNRHRAASYNEVSGRYVIMKPRFWRGKKARVQRGKPGDYYFEEGSPEQTAVYLRSKEEALETAWRIYQQRLDAGIAKEQAREDLPLSTMTQTYVTMNPRMLMHFLNLRTDPHALEEIRELAAQMEEYFKLHMPITYAAYKKYEVKKVERPDFDINIDPYGGYTREEYERILIDALDRLNKEKDTP